MLFHGLSKTTLACFTENGFPVQISYCKIDLFYTRDALFVWDELGQTIFRSSVCSSSRRKCSCISLVRLYDIQPKIFRVEA